ncbi:MAG: metalloregulator ArsR/SmtB family transcription factor [Firmicutes bacterium]|jgi:ArsR family transcriptional regulator|nr:metalloregulator ArsR/SmtB family transcription factor [Bacillota bacterium]
MKKEVKILKAVADENRLRILKMLQRKNGLCVCEIQTILGIGQSTTSRHLKILEDADLIRYEREGKWINCYLNEKSKESEITNLLKILSDWLEKEEKILHDKKKLKTINRNLICSQDT